MTNTEQPRNLLRLYMYQPLIELPDDKNEKEWQRRLEKTLQQKIWLSPISGLNDPFERHFFLESNPEYVLQNADLCQMLFDFAKKEQPDLTPSQFRDMLALPKFREKYHQLSKSFIRTIYSDHGVACFTNDPSNIPMWAHYANRHRGYCTIFELDISEVGRGRKFTPEHEAQYLNDLVNGNEILTYHYEERIITFVFTKVAYTDKPSIMRIEKLHHLQDNPYQSTKYLADKTLGVKYYQWQYENEYRLIANANSLHLNSSFNLPSCLKVNGIIMGTAVTEPEATIFDHLCKQYKCQLYQAKCSETEYRINHTLAKNHSPTEIA